MNAPTTENQANSGYIVNALYDCVFFIYSPLMALVLGIALTRFSSLEQPVTVLGTRELPINLLIGTIIAAHLVIVFCRSHANKKVFEQHPWRFTLVPLSLLAAIMLSLWVAVVVLVVAIWWDVYHSSLQTFGLGRIYDLRAGNDPEQGRSLDKWLNILLYLGPILAGASLMAHLDYFKEFNKVGAEALASVPKHAESWRSQLRLIVLGLGIPFLLYYLVAYWRLAQKGYKVSRQKVILYTSTGLCSIYTWGFNSFGQAFFIMNFFHALQYFAIIWWSEGGNMTRILRLDKWRSGKLLTLFLFLVLPLTYGFFVTTIASYSRTKLLFSLAMVVSIMHFWYDGFIWSVRKKQIS